MAGECGRDPHEFMLWCLRCNECAFVIDCRDEISECPHEWSYVCVACGAIKEAAIEESK